MFKRLGKRYKRKKTATLVSVGLGNNAIQFLTDSMANQLPVQIEYEGSGMRRTLPYGWSVSNDDNLLLMCYKEDGSIRSYRFDRMLQIMVEDSLIRAYEAVSNEPEIQEIQVEDVSPDDYLIPELPNIDEILEETENEEVELPYDDAIEVLDAVDEMHDIDTGNSMSPQDLVDSINEIEPELDINSQNPDWSEENGNDQQPNNDQLLEGQESEQLQNP